MASPCRSSYITGGLCECRILIEASFVSAASLPRRKNASRDPAQVIGEAKKKIDSVRAELSRYSV